MKPIRNVHLSLIIILCTIHLSANIRYSQNSATFDNRKDPNSITIFKKVNLLSLTTKEIQKDMVVIVRKT